MTNFVVSSVDAKNLIIMKSRISFFIEMLEAFRAKQIVSNRINGFMNPKP